MNGGMGKQIFTGDMATNIIIIAIGYGPFAKFLKQRAKRECSVSYGILLDRHPHGKKSVTFVVQQR